MKMKLILVGLALSLAGGLRADFNPVALTPGSYTFDIVVESNAPQPLPNCINVTTGNGIGLGDTSVYEQGFYARPGQSGGNSGIPPHNTTFVASNNPSISFLMPADYTTNNVLMIDGNFTSGAFAFNAPATATNLAILCTGGGGGTTLNYTVAHSDGSTETGSISMPDWFNGGSTVAWGANGRVTANGGYENLNTSSQNNNPPYLYCDNITVSGATSITNISFTFNSGAHANLFAVSGRNTGASVWTPISLSGFNVIATVPASFPLTATMDQGTNTQNNGNLNTWFEQGYYQAGTGDGLPPSGSTFSSQSQPTHHYQMGNYSSNNAILIDANHQSANITPSAPAPYSSFAFLTAGGNIGGGTMTNTCILQHQDGVNETNVFLGYDWFNGNIAPAYIANGRVDMYNRTLNALGSGNPKLFETYFTLNDRSSPVTNIVVKFGTAPSGNSTTYIMAVSATAGGVPPLINSGPLPATQTWFPGQTATFTVQVSGTAPITNVWLVQSNGTYYPLTDGVDGNGSTVSGSSTTTLTISGLTAADGTNYEYIAENAFGSATNTAPATLVINPGTPVGPIIDSQVPDASISSLSVFTNLPTEFAVTVDGTSSPPIGYQWYSGVPQTPANAIPNATNAGYVLQGMSGVTISCIVSNLAGLATSSPVAITIKSPITSPTPYQAAILGFKPVAYWPLNETSGPIAFDYVGNNNGLYKGSYTLGQPGVTSATGFGGATSVGFDGSSAYVDIPVNNLNITNSMTMIEWVQTSGENGNFTTCMGHSDASYRFDVDGSGTAHFADAGPDVTTSGSIADGQWHQLVGVYDGANQFLYVDGVSAAAPQPSTPDGSTDDVFIGGDPQYSPANRLFLGNIAQVSILTNALTAQQVAAVYASADFGPVIKQDVSPLISQVPAGAAMTFSVTVGGQTPFAYQWSNEGGPILGATNSSYSFNAAAGSNTYRVAISNAFGSTASSTAVLLGLTNPPPIITFNNGNGWALNSGAVITPSFPNPTNLTLTDGIGGEASSAFYDVGQYVGGFLASYVYSPSGSLAADGVTFCLQNSVRASNSVGFGGGDLGYTGIAPSVAFEMNLYPNSQGGTGIQVGADGSTPDSANPSAPYGSTGLVNIASGDPIYVQLYYMQNVLAVWLEDLTTSSIFTTNYVVGSLLALAGNGSAYIGFTGGDGGATSVQVVGNLQYSYTTPPVLSVTAGAPGQVIVRWPISVSTLFTLQQSSSVSGPWTPSNMSSLTQVGNQNQVTLTVGAGPAYFELTAP